MRTVLLALPLLACNGNKDTGGTVTAEPEVPPNTAPVVTRVALSPANPTTLDAVDCVARATDADGDDLELRYQWQVDGQDRGSKDRLPAGAAVHGEQVRCTVTAWDGADESEAASASLEVGNTPPEVLALTIRPDPAGAGDTLTAVPTWGDADGEDVTGVYAWEIDGLVVSGQTTDQLDSSLVSRGDRVTVTATPDDGTDTGTPLTSAELVIGNGRPSAPVLSLAPSAPVPGQDTLVCTVLADSVDPDGDAVFYSVRWLKNGQYWGTAGPAPSDLSLWDEWTCIYDTTDGTDAGDSGVVSVFVEPPVDLRFAVIGDYGTGGSNEAAVASLVEAEQPAFILTVGDNNYPDGEAATIDANIGQFYSDWIFPYTGTYGSTATVNRFWPSPGNHDWNTGVLTPYTDYFSLPGNERYYAFADGPARFIALDSDSDEPDGVDVSGVQADWFRANLGTETWQIPYFHHPPYSSGSHGNDDDMHWDWASHGIQLAFAGHEHNYERLEVQGVTYVITGHGGTGLRVMDEPIGGSQHADAAVHGATFVDLGDPVTRVTSLGVDGSVLDRFELSAGHDDGEVALVPFGSYWAYRDDGTAPGSGWTDVAYNDAGWSSGPGPLGYGGGTATTVSYGGDSSNKHITTWFRHSFLVSQVPTSALVRFLRDDGVRVFLNGTQLGRVNLPLGTINASTPASRTVAGDDETAVDELFVDPRLLQVGTNTLAVEVHQVSPTSSDIRFDLSLVARGDTAWVPHGAPFVHVDADEGPRWKHLEHDDSAWSSGAAAYSGSTLWFRHTFTGGDASDLWLELQRGDPAAVYLNGSLLTRFDHEPEPGWHGRWMRVHVDPRRLWPGDNVLAVALTNDGTPHPEVDLALVGRSR